MFSITKYKNNQVRSGFGRLAKKKAVQTEGLSDGCCPNPKIINLRRLVVELRKVWDHRLGMAKLMDNK